MDIRAHRARLEGGEKRLRLRLDVDAIANQIHADSLAARRQRSLVGPCLVSMSASRSCCHVRVETAESVPARYALAIWRLRCGWRMASFRALTMARASPRSLVPRLSCLRATVSST